MDTYSKFQILIKNIDVAAIKNVISNLIIFRLILAVEYFLTRDKKLKEND